ncbi:hypothetical protein C8J57DRAFT_1491541 [Mycena rebaudengoi]|nr:hypothetical protein C8J57DRAFT_1491541 [Mycena rebaudengoi]
MLSSIRPRSNASKGASTRSRNTAAKVESAAHAQLLAQKRARVPLVIKADGTWVQQALAFPHTFLPHLADIPAEYIRDHLPATATMQAAVHAVETSIPKGALPKELEILMNDIVAAACPTHILFPIHEIVFGVHCASLTALPSSHSATVSAHKAIPVVPLCIPSPETFSLLHSYLYTRQPETLLSALDGPCESDFLHSLRTP